MGGKKNFRLLVDEEQATLPGGEKVKEAIKVINACERSLFSFAIMSGRKEAVEHIYNLVVRLFRDDKHMVSWTRNTETQNPCVVYVGMCSTREQRECKNMSEGPICSFMKERSCQNGLGSRQHEYEGKQPQP